jgi:nitroreductase
VTHNPILETLMNRKSIRAYQEKEVEEDVIGAIVRAGQQAPFAYQLCSLLLSRKRDKNPFGAPLLFTICVDSPRLEIVMAQRDWKMIQSDLSLLLFGIQDASLMAQNVVIAAESLGMGSCFLGGAPYRAEAIIREYKLPKRVFPLVQLAMGHPAEDPPTRPRYPIDFNLFDGEYPEFSDELIRLSMAEMDKGYLAQDYYLKAGYQIPLEGDREETYTFEDYGWTEHISRKVGQWHPSPEDLLEPLAKCGFRIASD